MAAFGTPSYSSTVTGSRVSVKYGALAENSCTTTCSTSFTVTMPTGGGASGIWIDGFYMRFHDGSGYQVKAAKLMLHKASYNSGTGAFQWEIEANLEGDPPPSDTTFDFGVWFHIAVADSTVFRFNEKTASNFSGAGSSGQCDSTATCSDTTTFTSVGATGIPFRQMALRGFDLHTDSGNGLDIEDLLVDVRGYTANGNSAQGQTDCAMLGSTTEDVICEVGLTAIAANTFANSGLHVQNTGVISNTTQTGGSFNGYSLNSTASTTAAGVLPGLHYWQLTPTAATEVYEIISGCLSQTYTASPSPGFASWQMNWSLQEDSSPSLVYDSSQSCIMSFFP